MYVAVCVCMYLGKVHPSAKDFCSNIITNELQIVV